jgi:hypothetical protein
MRSVFSILLSLIIIYCSNAETIKNDKQYYFASYKNLFFADTNSMLNPISEELMVSSNVNDTDVVFVKNRCVVHAIYSEDELKEIEKKCSNESEWIAFYDNYSFYNDDVSMFIYERAMVITESDKKYIQFVFTTGDKITIDRKKSAGKLFFFNPETGVKQCDSFSFDRRNYKDF